MKRKINFFITLLLMLFLLTLALTACDGKECEHSYQSEVTKAATCERDGIMTYTCSLCAESRTEVIKALGHSYSEQLSSNATHHYNECVCGDKKNEALHISSGAPTSTKDEVCTVCGYVISNAVGIKFNTLTVSGNQVYGKVSNNTEFYSFISEVVAIGNAKYVVSNDIGGINEIPAKTIALNIGDNTVYITEYINNEPTNIYIVTIRRTPVYEVTFNTNGGSAVGSLTVEEDAVITAPTTTKAGYTFVSWDYDFTKPITKDTNITASWQANKDTTYKVEYYLENFDKNGYELKETLNLKGTTDTTATAEQKVFEHFTFNSQMSIMSGNIDGDGSQTLKVYYTRDEYTVSNANSEYGSISKSGSFVYDAYAYPIEITATSNLGCEFIGWYTGNTLLSDSQSYSFNIDCDIEARFTLKSEIQKFNVISTATTCSITGIKDKTVTEIVVPDCVTSISTSAFLGCSKLTSVTIPDSVTAIGGDAFSYCTSLTSVTIGNGVTSIGDYAFWGCTSLTSVTIGNSVTAIGDYAFFDCYKLVEVYDLSSSIIVTKGTEYNGYIGYYALDVYTSASAQSKLHTTSDGYIFYEDRSTVYLMGYISNSTVLTLPDKYNGENYAIYEFAFYGNHKITSVNILEGVTSIGDSAFYMCTSLTSVTIPDSVTTIGERAFYMCTSLTSVTIGNSVTTIGSSAFEYCSELTSVTIGNSVTSIGNYAFYNCTSLTSVTIPDSVTTIGDSAFYDSYSLSYNEYNNAYYIGNESNPYLVLIKAKNTSIDSCSINPNTKFIHSSAFYGCYVLGSVTIPDSVTSIGSYAFRGCTSLSYNEYNNAYYIGNESNPYLVLIKAKNTSIDSCSINPNTKFIHSSAFSYCTSLTSVTIPDSVITVGYQAFSGCTSLTSVTIPDSVTTVGDSAFYNCTSLTSVTIPDSVTTIGSYAFWGCTSLTSVTFANPDGWWRSRNSSATSGTSITGLSDTSIAATYLNSTYCNYYWKRR